MFELFFGRIEMNNEKLDTTLNLSLETEEAIRQKSNVLSNGVKETDGTWEVILKYHGDILGLPEQNMVRAVEILMNGYAIATVTREQLEQLVLLEQIEFIEMPKSLQYNTYRAKQVSCILSLTTGREELSGAGVLIGIIDSGIDYLLPDFQNEDGSRILYLWDQTLSRNDETGNIMQELSSAGVIKGREFTKEDIDRAIISGDAGRQEERYTRARKIVPSRDITGHGTAVAGIAAGSARSLLYQGIAPKSNLLVVKLAGNTLTTESNGLLGNADGVQEGLPDNLMTTERNGAIENAGTEQNFPLTTDLMRGINYVLQKALELQRPVVINLSIGDTYGAHDGTSLLERYIDSVCENGRNVICIGSGNEAVTNGHTSFLLKEEKRIEFSIAQREMNTNIQLWKNYVDDYTLELIAPNGESLAVNVNQTGKQVWITQGTQVLIYVGTPKPFSVNEEVFFDFLPINQYIDSGIWTFVFTPIGSNQHDYHLFLPNSNTRNQNTRFVTPTPELTMTIPAFSSLAFTVGAYDIVTNNYADFSGRDREISEEERLFFASNIKPDIAAPGVNITAPRAGGGYASFTGTSFAAPVVTGSVALMMEWGIVRGNDRFLYGEKIKAYLRKGARALGTGAGYPNTLTGWGALCVAESIPQ